MAGSVNLKSNTCNKHCNGLIGNRYEMPNVSYTCPLAQIINYSMRKIIIVIVFMVCFTETKSQIVCGIYQKTGVTISQIDWNVMNLDIYTKTVLGITSGIGLTFLNNKYWNLNFQLMILQVGGKEKVDLLDIYRNKIGEQITRFYFNYLTLNTTFRVRLPLDFLVPSIELGPRIDYLVWSDIDYDDYKKYNYGFDIGILISKALNEKLDLGFETTYNLQLNKIAKKENLSIKSGNIFSITLILEHKL